MKKVAFTAAIVDLRVKRLASQDKSMRLTVEVDFPSDNLVNNLNRLFKGDADVAVAIAEVKNA
jgi:DNA-binding cell septation regulator SpoVG